MKLLSSLVCSYSIFLNTEMCFSEQAKELVEKAPVVVKTGLKKDEADQIKKVLLEAGAEVEIL